jgi:hypothetical protein
MSKQNETLEAPSVEVDISEADELAGIVEAEKAAKPEKADKPARDAKQPDKAKDETVPHQALHEEREKRKAIEREAREYRKAQEERNTRLDERLKVLSEAMTPKPQPIDPRTNPGGYAQQIAERQAALERKVTGYEQQEQNRQRQEVEDQRLWNSYRAAGKEYTETVPDFMDAYNYLLTSRAAELEAMGFDQQTIASQIYQDERNLALNAQQTGANPADVAYKWAKARGFSGPKPQNGGSQLDRLKNAKDASETLSKTGGSAGGSGRISLETLDRMSPDEFQAFVARQNSKDPGGFDKLMARLEGGRA